VTPRQPRVSGKDLLAAMKKLGFEVIRSKGSHHFIRNAKGRSTVIPVHGNEIIGPGLLSKILRDCEIDGDGLREVL
jgi:predicted RNA binding protein YcfA (HicA-like mRNA interferase family)